MTPTLRQTALHAEHLALGGRMVAFAGYELPVYYRGIVEEHLAVRSRAGLFDISHMGELRVSGARATAFLQRVLSNDVSAVAPGGSQYNLLLNDKGGIVDDLFAMRRADDDWLLVANAANRDTVVDWLAGRAEAGVEIEDQSSATGLVALQGPLSSALLAPLLAPIGAAAEGAGPRDLAGLARFHFAPYTLDGAPVLVSRTGYTGEDGFEIFSDWDDTPVVWRALRAAGAEPCGLGARDTLRLEMCYPLHGNDISPATDPLAAGLEWAVALDHPGKDFVGRAALLELRCGGSERSLVVFDLPQGGIPRAGCPILAAGAEGDAGADDGGAVLGAVTSGTFSPSLRVGIGMGYVRGRRPAAGEELIVDVRGKHHPAVVRAKPL